MGVTLHSDLHLVWILTLPLGATESSCSQFHEVIWKKRYKTEKIVWKIIPNACKIYVFKIVFLANSFRNIRKYHKTHKNLKKLGLKTFFQGAVIRYSVNMQIFKVWSMMFEVSWQYKSLPFSRFFWISYWMSIYQIEFFVQEKYWDV